jgi:hypothetical protein
MAIDCKTALERLLEADPFELSGRGDSELAAHLRSCERCAVVAGRLLEGQAELAGALNELGPRVAVKEALSAARRRRRRTGWRRHAWQIAAPLAAAAAVTALFFARAYESGRRMPGELVSMPAPRIEAEVEVPAGRNVVVFETRDRSAKVIWFY